MEKSSYSKYVVVIALFFGLVYDIAFNAIPFLTTGRIVVLILFTYSLFHINEYKQLGSFPLIILIFAIISLFQSFFSGDYTQFSRFFWFTLYVIFGGFWLSKIAFRYSIDPFIVFISAISIQSLIILLLFLNIELKSLVAEIVQMGINFEIEYIYRGIGFTSQAGANLSIIQSFGVISGLIVLSKKTKENKTLIVILLITCFLSTLLIGRTGMIVSLIALGYFFIFSIKVNTKSIATMFAVVAMIIISITLLLNNISEIIPGFSMDYFKGWLTGVFTGEDNTLDVLINQQNFPPIEPKTLLGTGEVIGLNGSNAAGHDSGYIQTYYSLGLIFSILFYGFLLYYLTRNKITIVTNWGHFLIAIIFILELKEPFLFKYSFPLMVFILLYTDRFKKRNNVNKYIIVPKSLDLRGS